MKTHIRFCLVSLIIIPLCGCNRYYTNYQSLDDISTEEYYSSDILPDSLQNLYGSWDLKWTSGGFSGHGNGKEFDYMVFKRNGIFGIIKDESLIAYGKVTLIKRERKTSLNFISVKSANIDLCRDPEKYIQFISNDTLNLIAPCCDRFNIHLVRKNRAQKAGMDKKIQHQRIFHYSRGANTYCISRCFALPTGASRRLGEG